MLQLPYNQITDDNIRSQLEHIYQNAQGVVIILSAVPTATEPLLSANEWGVYSNVLYYRISNATILAFTPSSTITVT